MINHIPGSGKIVVDNHEDAMNINDEDLYKCARCNNYFLSKKFDINLNVCNGCSWKNK